LTIEQRVRIAAFQAIYRGETPSVPELAEQLGVAVEEAQSALDQLVGRGLATADEHGRLTGSHGLTLSPTDHRLIFALGVRYVWCAIDAVGIPAALQADANVASHCFYCSEPVTVTIQGGEPQPPAADSLRIGIGVAGSSGKVIEDVCPMINFFCSPEHAEAWAAATGGANILEIRQAAELGRSQWTDVAVRVPGA